MGGLLLYADGNLSPLSRLCFGDDIVVAVLGRGKNSTYPVIREENMEKKCLIISGGEFAKLPEDLKKWDYIIACDKGWQYAEKLGLRPDIILGDFDSSPMPDTKIPIERVPRRKDDTDTMLAARKALELGYKDITICCVFGGRLDHTLANIQTAAFLVSHGAKVRLLGTDTDALVFTDCDVVMPKMPGYSLSLFALTDTCEGVTVKGTKYEGENMTLTNAFPLGVSNMWTTDEAKVSVKSGILLVLRSKLKKGEHI